METAMAIVAAAGSLGISYLIGRSLTASMTLVALGGAVSGVGFAVLFFVAAGIVGHLIPGFFDAWRIGIGFVALLCGAPIAGALVAMLTHRHTERVDAARLPF